MVCSSSLMFPGQLCCIRPDMALAESCKAMFVVLLAVFSKKEIGQYRDILFPLPEVEEISIWMALMR